RFGVRHIASLQRQHAHLGFAAKAVFEHLDIAQELDWLLIADVVEAIWCVAGGRVGSATLPRRIAGGWTIKRTDHPFDDVIDVGEAALVMTVIEHLNGLPSEDGLREQEQRHVRSAPWAVYGEETQAC